MNETETETVTETETEAEPHNAGAWIVAPDAGHGGVVVRKIQEDLVSDQKGSKWWHRERGKAQSGILSDGGHDEPQHGQQAHHHGRCQDLCGRGTAISRLDLQILANKKRNIGPHCEQTGPLGMYKALLPRLAQCYYT